MGDWLTFPAVREAALFVLAIYGAALSTFNLWQSVRRERRTIRVDLSTAIPDYAGKLGERFAVLTATNTGHRPVAISILAFQLSSGERLFPMMAAMGLPGILENTRLPATLSDGQSARLYMPYREIGQALIGSGRTKKTKLTPVAEDNVGGVHKGKSWKIDPHEFAGLGPLSSPRE